MEKKKLPIGFYLKKADNVITSGINKIHSELNLNRTDWQILQSIQNGSDRKTITTQLLEFVSMAECEGRMDSLRQKGWVEGIDPMILTEQGKSVFEICLRKQVEFRQKLMQNVSEQDYVHLISTLERMIENLS